jgi:exopolyphosphatase/pppGpp-phosphohydrolase
MRWSHIIDFGSRSMKLYVLEGSRLAIKRVINYDLINHCPVVAEIHVLLDELVRDVDVSRTRAVGTAAVRRDAYLASMLATACTGVGISYETITQEREAALIRRAFCSSPELDVFNVGGGSIQIVKRDGSYALIPFGISDLNREYDLTSIPSERLVKECKLHIIRNLPSDLGVFIYTGGEKTYLQKIGATLADGGVCTGEEFKRVTHALSLLEVSQLEELSTFGLGWMSGAIASNLIVEAALEVAGVDYFIPSDQNIADGILAELLL